MAALEPVRHSFTHLRAVYRPVVVECAKEALDRPAATRDQAVRPGLLGLDDLPLPVAQQKIGELARQWASGIGPSC